MEKIEILQTKIATMKIDFEAKIAELEREIESLKLELQEEREANKKLNDKNKSLKQEVEEWKHKYEEEHKIVLKLTAENERLQAQIVLLQKQLDEVHKNNPGFNVEALQEIYKIQDEMRAKINQLEEENKSLENRINKIESTMVTKVEAVTKPVSEEEKFAELRKIDYKAVAEQAKMPDISVSVEKPNIDKKFTEYFGENPFLFDDDV